MLETIWQVVGNTLDSSGFGQLFSAGAFHWGNLVMIGIGLLFIYLAIKKGFEPLLLVPIGFGMLIGNIPYDASQLPLSVYDGPVAKHDLAHYRVNVDQVLLLGEDQPLSLEQAMDRMGHDQLHHDSLYAVLTAAKTVRFSEVELIDAHHPIEALRLLEEGKAIMVNKHDLLTTSVELEGSGVYNLGLGRSVFIEQVTEDGKYPQLWSLRQQDPWNASVLYWIFTGISFGFFPPLIFLGIGALTDFGPMLSNPKTLLLGAAAQFGIFGALLGALLIPGADFGLKEAASIGIIGGADGPTAIFTCSQLAPELLGAVALAAYSYMAMVPIIQPPIMRLLTSKEERRIRMVDPRPVSKTVKIFFPLAGFLLTAFFATGALPLLGMLFFGNLLRECAVTDRLAKTAQTSFIDIVTILLGISVGAKTSAASFLTQQTIFIFVLGVLAFMIATATGVLFAKLMNKVSKTQVNPLIGAAGVSAVPMAARVVHRVGQEEDPHNYLLMHAMGPNVAGVIGSAVAAGVLLSRLLGT